MHENPYTVSPLRPDSNMFIYRIELERVIEKIAGYKNPENIKLSGQSRIGKTTLVNRLFNKRIQEEIQKRLKDKKFIILYLDINVIPSDKRTLEEVYSRLYNNAQTEIKKKYKTEIIVEENNSKEKFEKFLNKLFEENIRMIVIFDEFARLVKDAKTTNPYDLLHLRSLGYTEATADVFKYITVSIQSINDLKSVYDVKDVSQFGNDCYPIVLKSLKVEQAEELINKSQEFGIEFTEEEKKIILEGSDGIPFLIQLGCYEFFFYKNKKLPISETIKQEIKEKLSKEKARIKNYTQKGESPDSNIYELLRNYTCETDIIELKTSVLWSQTLTGEEINQRAKESKEIEIHKKDVSKYILAKTIASFMNSKGGKLIIGIKEEDKYSKIGLKVVGIQDELKKLETLEFKRFPKLRPYKYPPNEDGYQRMIQEQIIERYFKEGDVVNELKRCLKISFENIDISKLKELNLDFDKNKNTTKICIIDISKSEKPIFLYPHKKSEPGLHIRLSGKTKFIMGDTLVDYIKSNFSAD